ncbi:hypothetical protein EJB05_38759, partial [Eragrostis curvula]
MLTNPLGYLQTTNGPLESVPFPFGGAAAVSRRRSVRRAAECRPRLPRRGGEAAEESVHLDDRRDDEVLLISRRHKLTYSSVYCTRRLLISLDRFTDSSFGHSLSGFTWNNVGPFMQVFLVFGEFKKSEWKSSCRAKDSMFAFVGFCLVFWLLLSPSRRILALRNVRASEEPLLGDGDGARRRQLNKWLVLWFALSLLASVCWIWFYAASSRYGDVEDAALVPWLWPHVDLYLWGVIIWALITNFAYLLILCHLDYRT